jgi:hypothetical protein
MNTDKKRRERPQRMSVMKKGKKILVVGLIGLMMAAGLILAGCNTKINENCPGDGRCKSGSECGVHYTCVGGGGGDCYGCAEGDE